MKVEISDVKFPLETLKPNIPISGVVIVQNDGNKEQKIEIVRGWTQENWKVPVPRPTPQAKIFCRNCGKELRNDSKFCDGCGQKV